jgi:hypothetical protein
MMIWRHFAFVMLRGVGYSSYTSLYRDELTTSLNTITAVNNLVDTTVANNLSVSSELDAAQDFRLTGASPLVVAQGDW